MIRTLEESRLFPIIAWIAIIGFAAFTLSLVYHLKVTFAEIDAQVTVTTNAATR